MNNKRKDWVECISYGAIGLLSAATFLFGVLFPKYLLVQECFADTDDTNAKEAVMSIEQLRARDIKVTSFSYECLKEILNEWD